MPIRLINTTELITDHGYEEKTKAATLTESEFLLLFRQKINIM